LNGAAQSTPSGTRVLLAWCVHALTASGAVFGALALIDVASGNASRAVLLMLVTLAIDSVDGTLARAVDAAHTVPQIDGRRLDDVVDYFNYAIVPALFLLQLGILPHWSLASAPILASGYGFAQREAKTDDHFFLGWPSYWNVVAIDLWLMETSPATASVIVLVFSVLVFVPWRYVYPSRTPVLRRLSIAGAVAWILVTAWAAAHPDRARELHVVEISLVYPAYYMALSAWLGDWLGLRGPRR
jgi:phosphatidylcholine synthase